MGVLEEIPNNHADIASRFFPNYATTNSEGLLNAANLALYFGPPSGGFDMVARDARVMDHYQFPAAYNGTSEYLGGYTIGLILEKQEWLYSEPYGLPLREAQANDVTFEATVFEESYLEQIPEEGVGRVMGSSVRKGKVTLLRRGKAIFLEHGFWKTNVGKRHYVNQVQQVVNATSNTLQMDALVKMANIRPRDIEWMSDYWMKGKTTKEILEHYITRFARLNKDSYEAEHMVNEYTEILEARGKGPEVIIAPRGVEPLFTGAVNSDKLDIDKVGPELAEKRMLQQSDRITRFANLTMKFTRRYLNFIGGQIAADPLQRGRLFGEFVQLPPISLNVFEKKVDGKDYEYKTDHRKLQVMDYKLDCEKTIGLKGSIEYFNCFNTNGYLKGNGYDSEPTSTRKPLGHKEVQSPFEYRGSDGNIYPCKLFGQIPLEFVSKEALIKMESCLDDIKDASNVSLYPNRANAIQALIVNALYPAASVDTTPDELLNYTNTRDFFDRLYESINGKDELTRVGKNHPSYTGLGSFYGRFLQTTKPTHVSVDIKQKADHVLTQLTNLNAHVPYGTLLSKLESDELKNAAIERSYYLLSRSPDEIKQELLEPLNAIQNPSSTITKTEAVKQEKKLINQLTAPVPQHVSASLHAVDPLVSTGYDVFSDKDIKEAQSRGLEFEQVTKLPSGGLKSPGDVMAFFNTIQHKAHTGAGLKEPKWNDKLDEGAQDIFYRIKENGSISANMALLLFQRLNKKFFEILHEFDIYDPFHYIFCRPFVHVVTNTVLIGTGGSRLGNTLIRQPDVMLKDNAVDKTHLVFMTMYNTAVVVNHLLMCCVDDVSVHSYLGNGNTRFMEKEEFSAWQGDNYEIPEDDNYGAMFVLIAAVKGTDRIPSMFSLDRSLIDDSDPVYFHDNEYLASYIKQTPPDNHPYYWNDQTANKIICQIPQRLYNPITNMFDLYISGEISHLGGNHYRGMMRDLKSGKRLLKKNDLANPDKYKPWFDL